MSFPYLSDLVYFLSGYRLPLPIAMFGLFVAFGVLAAGACLRRELVRLQGGVGIAPPTIVNDFAFVVLLAGVIGARLFHILEHLDEFAQDPWSMIFSRSGLSIFGGLIFGAGAGLLLLRRWKVRVRPFLDAIAPAPMLGYAIGRIGCQVSGDGDWGIAAPGLYPAPIYETLMAAACFVLLWSVRKHSYQAGGLLSLYLVLAGAERLLIEQIRVNVRFHIHALSFTQAELISVLFLLLGAAGMLLLSRPASVTAPAAPRATGSVGPD